MNSHPISQEDPGLYEIRVQGHLPERWLAWFDGMTPTHTPDKAPGSPDREGIGVITILRGHVADQAALHGMLARLRDFGLPLISVARVEAEAADEAGAEDVDR